MKGRKFARQLLPVCAAAAVFFTLLVCLLLLARRDGTGIPGAPFWVGTAVLLAGAAGWAVSYMRNAAFQARLRKLVRMEDPEEEELEELPQGSGGDDSPQALLDELETRLQETSSVSALRMEAELRALQYQINPHFLYNTLEIIRSSAMLQGNTDVCEMVESLAMQFRYCINSSNDLATLQQELDHVQNYMLIQHHRFGDRIRFKVVIADEDEWVLQSKLPVLTLQPIIENALLHGINPKVEGGCITLRIELTYERLHILVEDDGIGMPEAELQRMRHLLRENKPPETPPGGRRSTGIALRNVNARIHLYFGENYGLDVQSTEGLGTTVSVTLPITCMEGE